MFAGSGNCDDFKAMEMASWKWSTLKVSRQLTPASTPHFPSFITSENLLPFIVTNVRTIDPIMSNIITRDGRQQITVLFSSIVTWNTLAQSVQWLGYGRDNRGINSRQGIEIFLHICSGVHRFSYKMGIRADFFGVKRPELEADISPPSSAEV
jgi:hypothetical protein